MINAFTYGTTCEALIHALHHETLCMTQELLDIATKYATGEEAVQANFSSKAKAASHLSGGDSGDDHASAQRRHNKMARDRKHYGEMLAVGIY
jgi:hypothetical protein